MKTGTKAGLVCVAAVFILAGCGQNNAGTGPGQSGTAEKPAPAKPTASKETGIKIKGLYIGMDIQTVPAVLKDKIPSNTFSEVTEVGAVLRQIYGDEIPEGSYRVKIYDPSEAVHGGDVIAGPDGKVIIIDFSPWLVEKAFKAEHMEDSEFVKAFVDFYQIPKMSPTDGIYGFMCGWTYTSPDGVKVDITSGEGFGEGFGKHLIIKKVPSQKELKQAFD